MKSRPILMSGPMVRALLEDRKTQTRRIVKPQPSSRYGNMPSDAKALRPYQGHPDLWIIKSTKQGVEQYKSAVPFADADGVEYFRERCPYGQPGDLLWVREGFSESGADIFYRATDDEWYCGGRWKPSIHMPRRDSRLTLELTDIRVERLQDISEADAQAEGTQPTDTGGDPRAWFAHTWEKIHSLQSWIDNPWVWVLCFNVHQRNVDDLMREAA